MVDYSNTQYFELISIYRELIHYPACLFIAKWTFITPHLVNLTKHLRLIMSKISCTSNRNWLENILLQ